MPNKKNAPHHNPSEQSKRFTEAARELGCDENEEAVDELMKRVASSPPPRKDEKAKKLPSVGKSTEKPKGC